MGRGYWRILEVMGFGGVLAACSGVPATGSAGGDGQPSEPGLGNGDLLLQGRFDRNEGNERHDRSELDDHGRDRRHGDGEHGDHEHGHHGHDHHGHGHGHHGHGHHHGHHHDCGPDEPPAPDCQVDSRAWGTPAQVEAAATSDPGLPVLAQVATDATGNAVAVWKRMAPPNPNAIHTSRFESGAWTPVEILDTGNVGTPRVVTSSGGSAIASWTKAPVPGVAHFVPGSGWSSLTGPWTILPVFALDADGNALAAWTDGGSVLSSSFDTTSWSSPVTVASAGTFVNAALTSNDDGDAALVWQDSGIWLARYVAGTWSAAESVASAGELPRVGVDADGNVLVLWEASSGVSTRYYPSGAAGGTTEVISGSGANESQVAFNAGGQALAVWQDGASLQADVFDPASGWAGAQEITNDFIFAGTVAAGGDDFGVGLDACGAGNVIFRRGGSAANLWAARYVPGSAFSLSELEALPSASYYPDLATAANGVSTIVWEYGFGLAIEGLRFE